MSKQIIELSNPNYNDLLTLLNKIVDHKKEDIDWRQARDILEELKSN